jgi:CheY-like chemotaxis protein
MDEPPASPQTTCRGLRLLVAENEEVSQKLIGVLAHQLGCETVVVDDGRSALEAWRNKPFDILLLDCFMPGLDGFEVARGIRAEEARTRRSDPASPAVYMIAMTANTMAGDRETCLDAGMDDYLAQPITLAALLRGANHRSRFSKAA